MTKYLLIAIGILALACAFLWGGLEYERGEASRLRENQAALLDEVKFYQTESGKSAASVQALTLSKNELEKNFEEKCQLVEELGLKVKRLQSMSYTGTSSHIVQSRDTLVQIVHRVPKRFLFFRFGTKAIRQEVVSMNPHTKVAYADYIELKK